MTTQLELAVNEQRFIGRKAEFESIDEKLKRSDRNIE
jgi:hypothetical protein